MTEQQRREQIMKARQQAQGPAVPSMSDADAARLVQEGNGLTQEQMIAVAMFGKVVQNDVHTIRKAGLGDLKVTDVDMSKVMPSGIARAVGRPMPAFIPPPQAPMTPPPAAPVAPPPVPVQMVLPAQVIQSQILPADDQLEFNFNKTARYEDVIEAIEKMEKKINIVNEKLDLLLAREVAVVEPKKDKKKLTSNTQVNGT